MKLFLISAIAFILFCVSLYAPQIDYLLTLAMAEYRFDKESFFKKGTPHRKIEESIQEYSNFLEKEKGLERKMLGLNREIMDQEPGYGSIDTISLAYSLRQHIGYQEARALFYEIADGFIAHMNEQKELLQYFYKPPIGYEHLDFKLSFDYGHTGNLKVGEIASVLIRDGKIHYSVVEEESPPQVEFVPTGDPEVFTLGNFCFNTRWVSRPLPETEQDIATEP